MKLLTEYTSGTPLAKPSTCRDEILLCTTCGMRGMPGEFMDARESSLSFPAFNEDTYDCPCCGMTTVVVDRRTTEAFNIVDHLLTECAPKTWYPKTIAECEMDCYFKGVDCKL